MSYDLFLCQNKVDFLPNRESMAESLWTTGVAFDHKKLVFCLPRLYHQFI